MQEGVQGVSQTEFHLNVNVEGDEVSLLLDQLTEGALRVNAREVIIERLPLALDLDLVGLVGARVK